ncbi:uncharacterized membrane protein (DUF485 family) [Nakamurella sp. UYEF19]|uniref:hypothetical protein n=1 Tax=Nakamurella sp. UYEF19 TaxID=1756392 RepID=UPI003397EDAA
MTSERVRVVHPRTEAARRPPHRPPSRDIEEQTELGRWYVASLMRSQRRLALLVTVGGVGGLMLVALLSAVLPAWTTWRLFGMSVPWLILGLVVYPVMIIVAALAVRRAERNEKAFTDWARRP